MVAHSRKIEADSCALLIIDLQERFAAAIEGFDAVVANSSTAMRGAALLDVPIVMTEQYPQGLGQTVEALRVCAEAAMVYEKNSFSALGCDQFRSWLEDSPVRQIVLAGVESHVCVTQTALDLIALGYEVFVLEECISSRTAANRVNGLERMKAAGAWACNVESFLFEVLGSSGHPRFKEISQLIR